MSTMAVSSLNPDAPLFIPAAYRQVEDFSPEWWDLVKTTAWFRDHWFRQHQLLDEAEHRAALAALPAGDDDLLLPDDLLDTDDLFYAPDHLQQYQTPPTAAFAPDAAVLRALSLNAPATPREQHPRHADKPAQHVGLRGAARRVIHQPR